MVLGKDGEGQLERSCEEELRRKKEERNILHAIRRKKAD
jgi:hypothetical protein